MRLLEKFLNQFKTSTVENKQFSELQKKIGYNFKNIGLLEAALTHTSRQKNIIEASPFERMEFLGDSVLGLIVAEELFFLYPSAKEGEMSKLKSKIVSQKHLFAKAKEMELGNYVLLSKEADFSGGRKCPRILTDSFESLICAIYIDSSYEKTYKFVKKFILQDIEKILTLEDFKNYKSILQEKIQSQLKKIPTYKVITEKGPEHKKVFTVTVSLNGKILGKGSGYNKKEAQQIAAKEALKMFTQ